MDPAGFVQRSAPVTVLRTPTALPALCRSSICLRRPPFTATDILGALDSGESIT